MTKEEKIAFLEKSTQKLKSTIVKLTPLPLTTKQLGEINLMDGNFDDNLKLAIEARNNTYLLKEK